MCALHAPADRGSRRDDMCEQLNCARCGRLGQLFLIKRPGNLWLRKTSVPEVWFSGRSRNGTIVRMLPDGLKIRPTGVAIVGRIGKPSYFIRV